jgi:pyruvate,orthophosphate dikinase
VTPLVHAFPAPDGQPPDPGRALLGGKGAGLVLMSGLGLPVPPGFVITTAAAREHAAAPELRAVVRSEVERLERRTGRRFGDGLTVSVRSGAPESMPGMLDTVLDVGTFAGLHEAVEAVVRSWDGERAVAYRRLRGLDDATGTAVVVQAMVDGTAAGFSGTGVVFTRDPATGAPGLTGEFLPGARGPDLVDGRRTPEPLATLATGHPLAYRELAQAAGRLERELADLCEIEFTVEGGRLWLLQVRAAKRTERARLRVAVDLAREGLISREEAVRRCPEPAETGAPATLGTLPEERLLCRGLPGSPGAAVGRIALDLAAAEEYTGRGDTVILVRAATDPADLPAMTLAAGVLTTAGGTTSHAAVVARELGVPCVCGATGLRIDLDRRVVHAAGRELAEGTVISIDGTAAVVAAGAHDTGAGDGVAGDVELRRILAGWATI